MNKIIVNDDNSSLKVLVNGIIVCEVYGKDFEIFGEIEVEEVSEDIMTNFFLGQKVKVKKGNHEYTEVVCFPTELEDTDDVFKIIEIDKKDETIAIEDKNNNAYWMDVNWIEPKKK